MAGADATGADAGACGTRAARNGSSCLTPALSKSSIVPSPMYSRLSHVTLTLGVAMPSIGRARTNGAAHHGDWMGRQYHKKCFKRLWS